MGNSENTWRLLMRTAKRLSSVNSISYSFNDEQVVNLVRVSFIAGILVTASVVAIALKVLA